MKQVDYWRYGWDAPAFARDILHFNPDPVQLKLLGSTPFRCILNCTRQWGKSTITAIKALHHALFNNDTLILVVSPSERQSGEFIHKVAHLSHKAGFKPRGDGKNGISLLFPNNSRIVGLPSKEDTIRGFSGVSLLLIDEASRVPDALYKTVRPMLAASGGALWLISTPAGRTGFFYETWQSADPEWTRISVRATDCPRIHPTFLDSERRTLGEHAFRQEYLCEFHDSDEQLLSQEYLDRARSKDVLPLKVTPPPHLVPVPTFHPVPVLGSPPESPLPEKVIQTQLYLGIDFGQVHDYTALAIVEKSWVLTGPRNHWNYERTREERFSVRFLERMPLGTPYTDIVARIGQISRSFGDQTNLWLCADATGVGRPVVEMIRSLQLPRRMYAVKVTPGNTESCDGIFYNVPKSHLIGNLILQFEGNMFKVCTDLDLADTLLEELGSLRVKVSTAGNDIYSTWRTSQHDDLLFAVALANWQAQKDKWYVPSLR
jgi:hypothetical protein